MAEAALEQLDQDFLGAVGRGGDAVGGEHAERERLGQPLLAELLVDQRRPEQPALERVAKALGQVILPAEQRRLLFAWPRCVCPPRSTARLTWPSYHRAGQCRSSGSCRGTGVRAAGLVGRDQPVSRVQSSTSTCCPTCDTGDYQPGLRAERRSQSDRAALRSASAREAVHMTTTPAAPARGPAARGPCTCRSCCGARSPTRAASRSGGCPTSSSGCAARSSRW